MVKKIQWMWRLLAALLVMSALLVDMEPAYAEQTKAEEYRRILNSGKFYIEYSVVVDYGDPKLNKKFDDGDKKILAVDGTRRILYTKGFRFGDGIAMSQPKSPFYAKIVKESMSGQNKMRPDILCANGDFYLFCGKNKAIRATAEQLLDDALEAYWYQMENMVGLPRAFYAICPEMANQSLVDMVSQAKADFAAAHPKLAARRGAGVTASFASEFVESGTKELFGQRMNFDRYILHSTSEEMAGLRPGTAYAMGANGMTVAMPDPLYEFYYDETGNLCYIRELRELSPEAQAQQEAQMQLYRAKSSFGVAAASSDMYIRIAKISGDIPTGLFEIPKGYAVYAADTGTIDDLLGEPKLVEQH